MTSKLVVVTGAAGFIGSHLCERLIALGQEVVGIDSFTDYYERSRKEENLAVLKASSGFTFKELDLVDADLRPVLRGAGTVYHLAGQPGVRPSWGEQFDRYVRDNIIATQRLLEALKEMPIDRLVFAGSSSVYGDAEMFPTKESALPRPVSPYGVTKLAAEHLALLYARNFGLPVVSVRYFTVYGPRQRPDMAFHRFCRAMLAGEPITVYGDGHQSRDFTFVSDAVEANVRAWKRAAPQGVYNVGGGSQVEVLEAISLLEKSLGRKARVNLEPRPAGDPLRTRADATRLATDLGYATKVGIADGLAAQADWARTLYGGVR